MAVTYVLNLVVSLTQGVPPGALTIIASLLLIANIRGTYIAAKWAAQGGPDAMPERRHETFADNLVDQLPPKVWPIAKIPFFCIAGLYLALTLLGVVMLALHVPQKLGLKQKQPASQTIEVTPSR